MFAPRRSSTALDCLPTIATGVDGDRSYDGEQFTAREIALGRID